MEREKIVLLAILFCVWLYGLYVERSQKLTAFHFITGIVGFFFFTFTLFKNQLTVICSKALMWILGGLGHIFSFYSIYPKYNVIFIENKDAAISMFVDYECAGVIEILVVVSLVCFFPLFSLRKKIFYSIIGILYTMLANTIRLLTVAFFIYIKGSDFYYIAHAVIGRIVFYVLTVIFYFYLLSYSQIKNQKVGDFDYADNGKRI